jgi:hypothetical protein
VHTRGAGHAERGRCTPLRICAPRRRLRTRDILAKEAAKPVLDADTSGSKSTTLSTASVSGLAVHVAGIGIAANVLSSNAKATCGGAVCYDGKCVKTEG